jgi:hypothetical protein
MAKRKTAIDRALEDIDHQIAALELARKHLVKSQQEAATPKAAKNAAPRAVTTGTR